MEGNNQLAAMPSKAVHAQRQVMAAVSHDGNGVAETAAYAVQRLMVGKIYIYGMTKILNCGNSKHAANHEHSDTKSKVAALRHSCCHTVRGGVKK